MDKVQEIRELIEHNRSNHYQEDKVDLADECEYLLSKLDAAKSDLNQIAIGRFELLNENIYLQQQLDAAKQENVRSVYEIDRLWLLIGAERKQLKQAIKALEFYAAEETYDIEHLDRYGYIIIDKDHGEKARSILSLLREETGGIITKPGVNGVGKASVHRALCDECREMEEFHGTD